jgi:hypothetical protein
LGVRKITVTLALNMISLLMPSQGHAHKFGDSFMSINTHQQKLHWSTPARDLHEVIDFDADKDGKVSLRELKAKRASVAAHMLGRLTLRYDDKVCAKQLLDLRAEKRTHGAYVTLAIEHTCTDAKKTMEVHDHILAQSKSKHRCLVFVTHKTKTQPFTLTAKRPGLRINIASFEQRNHFVKWVREGVWHVWIGFDHILFLWVLLLPAVLIQTAEGRRGVVKASQAWWSLLSIVSVFTVAHSLTLALAVFQVFTPAAGPIESLIALSIVFAALHNLRADSPLSSWQIAFAFGLIHGFGFANVLADLHQFQDSNVLVWFAFNFGVELGQLSWICAFFPLAYSIRHTKFYRTHAIIWGSWAAILIATYWFVESIGFL